MNATNCCHTEEEWEQAGQIELGPIFFEFIQRKGDEGFGNGNFKAFF